MIKKLLESFKLMDWEQVSAIIWFYKLIKNINSFFITLVCKFFLGLWNKNFKIYKKKLFFKFKSYLVMPVYIIFYFLINWIILVIIESIRNTIIFIRQKLKIQNKNSNIYIKLLKKKKSQSIFFQNSKQIWRTRNL